MGLGVSIDPKAYDFGTISMKDGKVTKSFIIKNEDRDTELASVSTSCMCTEAKIVMNGSQFGPFGMPSHGPMKMLNQKLFASS